METGHPRIFRITFFLGGARNSVHGRTGVAVMTPQRLKQYRLLLGLSTAEAAHLLEVAQRTYQCYEKGARTIPGWMPDVIYRIVRDIKPIILNLLDEADL